MRFRPHPGRAAASLAFAYFSAVISATRSTAGTVSMALVAALAPMSLPSPSVAAETVPGGSVPAAVPVPGPVPAPVPAPAVKPKAEPSRASPPSTKSAPPTPVSKPRWVDLTPAQQTALQPLAAEWDRLDSARKIKWLTIGSKYGTLKPDQQVRLQERMREWAKLTPDQRRVARESYSRAKKLNPSEKSAEWQNYQKLPEEQKKKLADEASVKKRVANLPPVSQQKPKINPPPKSTLKTDLQKRQAVGQKSEHRALVPAAGNRSAAPGASTSPGNPPPASPPTTGGREGLPLAAPPVPRAPAETVAPPQPNVPAATSSSPPQPVR
ncbi:MAG: hypothetical protein JWR22_1195 [Herminiimonas sp.]|nr:hypothetical protein [Herminiimonas sp.]